MKNIISGIIIFLIISFSCVATKDYYRDISAELDERHFDYTVPVKFGERELIARGYDCRIDLFWDGPEHKADTGYHIFRSESRNTGFKRINKKVHAFPVYSDFIGKNGKTYYYKVQKVDLNIKEGKKKYEQAFSKVASAVTKPMTDRALLTSVQLSSFLYFWFNTSAVSGLAFEDDNEDVTCPMAANGFGLATLVVGVSRGFVSRERAALRVLKIVRFLQDKAVRYHGAWPHWMNGHTGETLPFGGKNNPDDNGADLVETSFMLEGMLIAEKYFNKNNPAENEIRLRVRKLWDEVEWKWFLREEGGKTLYWHWSPTAGWAKNLPIKGYNECLITYVMAIASKVHPIPPDCYEEGWAGSDKSYVRDQIYYGYKQWVGPPLGGPLFLTQYSFIGLDPRQWRDKYCNYFQNSRNISLINRAYCGENPKKRAGYSLECWGITASRSPFGYRGMAPGERDNGTISPTAALSAMAYTPAESMQAIRHFYHEYGNKIWKHFGFTDAFNPTESWYSQDYLGLDQGPIAPMIENARTGLCWKLFMKNEDIISALKEIGWKKN